MSCSCGDKNTLHYITPSHGGWSVVRMGMLAPESIQLFVCPFACGRHGAIGATELGLKDRLHYLYVSQSDIIDGYDDLIPGAVEEVLDTIEKRPKVFFVFVSCLDDLIGTDHEALIEKLSSIYPDIAFRVCHMNPISLGSKTPPPISIQNNLYSLLTESGEKEKAVNQIGNNQKIFESSEIYDFLFLLGFKELRHISSYETFSSYQEMARSSFSLVFAPAGKQAAEGLDKRFSMPYLFTPVSYDIEEIRDSYKKIASLLGVEISEDVKSLLSCAEEKALSAIEEARKACSLPIIIDSTAVIRPFSLAKALTSYGFTVKRIEADEVLAFDEEHFKWIEENCASIEIFKPQNPSSVLFERRDSETLAIGVEAAYLASSKHVVDLHGDLGMFGYDAVIRLMRLIKEAAEKETDLEALIKGYSLVV